MATISTNNAREDPTAPSERDRAWPDGVAARLGRAGSAREIVIDGRKYLLVPLDGAPPPPQEAVTAPSPRAREVLTERELEVARLVARGRRNKQIAAELHISTWTVAAHLRRIFAKLDVDTRAAMVGKCLEALDDSER